MQELHSNRGDLQIYRFGQIIWQSCPKRLPATSLTTLPHRSSSLFSSPATTRDIAASLHLRSAPLSPPPANNHHRLSFPHQRPQPPRSPFTNHHRISFDWAFPLTEHGGVAGHHQGKPGSRLEVERQGEAGQLSGVLGWVQGRPGSWGVW
ncbi:hypothetical protein Droror1_Dr00006265 [Drosera rotundifolia]